MAHGATEGRSFSFQMNAKSALVSTSGDGHCAFGDARVRNSCQKFKEALLANIGL